MLEQAKVVVTNMTPRIALTAATGSLEVLRVLLKAKSIGYSVSMPEAIGRMRERGIWLSNAVISFALAH